MAAHRRYDWHARIAGVELEFVAARAAADALICGLERGDIARPRNPDAWDVPGMSANLEGTYLIRLFAAFEAGLRSYWGVVRGTEPQARDLIEAVGAKRSVPPADREAVHNVREYRNSLIHERSQEPEPLTMADARGRLQRYFARLPERW